MLTLCGSCQVEGKDGMGVGILCLEELCEVSVCVCGCVCVCVCVCVCMCVDVDVCSCTEFLTWRGGRH